VVHEFEVPEVRLDKLYSRFAMYAL
jgi:hypothetical protein